MKNRKSIFILLILICSAHILKAQFLSTQQGSFASSRAVTQTDYVDVIGTAFLTDGWSAGTAMLATGAVYKGDLKYDLVKDQIFFKGDKGEDMLFVDPVKEFTIADNNHEQKHFRDGYNSISDFSSKTFFEVLADGDVQLIKKTKKIISESTPYNASTPERKFVDMATQYFIVTQGKAVTVKKDEKSVLAALGNKQTELDTYIKTNKLNLKNDADIAKLIDYYNSI